MSSTKSISTRISILSFILYYRETRYTRCSSSRALVISQPTRSKLLIKEESKFNQFEFINGSLNKNQRMFFLNPPFLIEFRLQQKEQFLQFSKSPIQDTFGDLPFGEIPEPLKYVRPFRK